MFTWRAAVDVVLRRPLAFAIVDEADSILIDRSVEPHILSGAPQGGDDPLQYRIACMVRTSCGVHRTMPTCVLASSSSQRPSMQIAQGLRVRMEKSDSAGVLDALAMLQRMLARVVNPSVDLALGDEGGVDAVVYRQSGYARLTNQGAARVVQSIARLGRC